MLRIISNCAKVALDITTYVAGQNQCTHPNVAASKEEWRGYRHWMAYTANPAYGFEEKPFIAVSGGRRLERGVR